MIGTSVIAVVGLIALARMLWAARLPAGLEMTELGIHGIRGAGEAHLMWDDIADAGVVAAPAAKLSIADVNGSHPVLAATPSLGADPNDGAVVLRFFRDHPDERSVLTEGGEWSRCGARRSRDGTIAHPVRSARRPRVKEEKSLRTARSVAQRARDHCSCCSSRAARNRARPRGVRGSYPS